MTIFYVYFLGLFAVGPFTTLSACEAQRAYQLTYGAREEVSECWVVAQSVTYSLASPTYGAPLTPAEYARRLAE